MLLNFRLAAFLIFCNILLFSSTSGASSSGSSQIDPVWIQLFQSCFGPEKINKNGYPKGDEFTIKAQDDFRDVELTFAVFGDENRCKLEWDDWLVPCGRLKSIDRRTGSPVKKLTAKTE